MLGSRLTFNLERRTEAQYAFPQHHFVGSEL